MEKTLVVYYSKSGNTRRVANKIKDMTNADIYEVKMKKDDTSDLGDMLRLWFDPILPVGKVSKKNTVDFKDYDHVYIGTPVWGMTYALPIKEFMQEHDFTGKKVSLFCTHDGGMGATLSAMKRKASKGSIEKTLDIISSTCRNHQVLENLLKDWMKEVN